MATFDELFATLPVAIEPEFVMSTLNAPIELVLGPMEVFRNGQRLAALDGRIALEWTPRLRIECSGDSDDDLHVAFADDQPVELRVGQIGLRAEAFVTAMSYGARQHASLLITSTDNPSQRPSACCRFYLVNFCDFIGDAVRYGQPPTVGVGRNRLSFSSGDLRYTVDRIRASNGLISTDGASGYLVTHVGSLSTISGTTITPDEMRDALDALYWFFTFMRGARSGPILPSTDVPFAAHWISLSPWRIDEPRNVHSWVPDRARIELSPLFDHFLQRWRDPDWNEAIRTTLAWYVTANSPSIPNEARIPLCQIALEVLASLHAAPGTTAFQRLRALLSGLSIPVVRQNALGDRRGGRPSRRRSYQGRSERGILRSAPKGTQATCDQRR
jgi:hypothetical protein